MRIHTMGRRRRHRQTPPGIVSLVGLWDGYLRFQEVSRRHGGRQIRALEIAAEVARADAITKSIRRRLLTWRGGFDFSPEYGMPLPAGILAPS